MKTEEMEQEDIEIKEPDPFDKNADDFHALQNRMLELKRVSINDPDGVQNAIAVLTEVGDKAWSFVNSDYWWEWSKLERADISALFNIFSKQLALLKKSEGCDLKTASLALKDCIRLAILFMTFLYDYYGSLTHLELKPELLECVNAGDILK